ncbi:MAG: kinase/pyrophosphorylase [Clostridiales bacterium]|nr:kinase/pyrophosphorylase [Clostridiales bacterium]
MEPKVIYILSDSLGDTAEYVLKATAGQFKPNEYLIKKFSFVSTAEQVQYIFEDAKSVNALIVFTIVIEEVKEEIIRLCNLYNLLYFDIMSPLLNELEVFFGSKPTNEPGIIRKLDATYFKKVEAIEFAVKYDDGKDPRGVKKADVVLLGISRTSKTPLSMYLANKNLRVTNIPLVPEVPVPKQVFEVNKDKIIGLTTDPYKLNEIRVERIKALGLGTANSTYADMKRILEELDYADKIYKRIGCPVINVSNKAVEETANIIIKIIKSKGQV